VKITHTQVMKFRDGVMWADYFWNTRDSVWRRQNSSEGFSHIYPHIPHAISDKVMTVLQLKYSS